MLLNNLKILWKNLKNNKVYTFINIFGLAVGISASTLIALYIHDELSYDSHHEKNDRIYRLTTTLDMNGEMDVAVTNYALAPTLLKDYPEVKSYARFFGGQQENEIEVNNEIFNIDNLWITDSTVFEVFTYDMIIGDPTTALAAPNSIVLTEQLAERLFGRTDVVGEEFRTNNSILSVTGVIANPPSNSEIPINGLISISTLPQGFHQTFNQDWFRIAFHSYILTNKPIDTKDFAKKLDEVNEKYVLPWGEANGTTASHDYHITPLKEVHFDHGLEYDLPKGRMSNIYIFAVLAIFLLLIASFNFINLTLAQQSKRSKEVGIRKTLGATRKSLIVQFLMESFVITFVSIILGLALTELFIDQFNDLSAKNVAILDILEPGILFSLIGIFILIGGVAGAYPAFVLSSAHPVTILAGQKSGNGRVGILRKSLIMLQFLFSLFMIAGTSLIGDQMNYIQEKNLGFDRENLISLNLPSDTTARKIIAPWIEELKGNPKIASFSRSALPTGGPGELMFRVEMDGQLTEKTVKTTFVDEHFIEVLNLKMLQGRNFSPEIPTDAVAFIVNETAAKQFGWGNEPLDKRVQWGLLDNNQAQNDGKVIGLINDFHFMSLHNPLEPLILCYNPAGGNGLSIRLAAGDYSKTLDALESSWSKLLPSHDFNYSFFDEDLETNYAEEIQMYRVFSYFAIVSILLACLGLFSLLSYSIQSRTKEIGIRKVLGASTRQISWIIAKDFFMLLGVAFIISTPIAYYLWLRWLEDYAYQSPLNIGSLVISLLLGIGLSLLAVAYHSWRISRQNPIDSIREE